MAPLDDIIGKIEGHTKLARQEIRDKIQAKKKELLDMVSDEGAAHLVAKELGVGMANSERRKLDIINIVPGMRNVTAAGRVFKTSNVVNFKKSNGTDGRVVNIFVGDRTGFVRVALWNEHVSIVEDEHVMEGDIVQISGAFARENIYGDIELSIGKFGRVFQINEEVAAEGIDFPTAEELSKIYVRPRKSRVPIKNLSPGQFEIRGIVVDVIRGNFIFNTCPDCGGKLSESDGKYTCSHHGDVESKPEMVVSFIMDDGTGALRVVAFRALAEKIATTTASELSKLNVDERYKSVSGSILGKEFIINGNVKKNRGFDRLEMIANTVQNLNISEESERLADLLKMKLG